MRNLGIRIKSHSLKLFVLNKQIYSGMEREELNVKNFQLTIVRRDNGDWKI